LKRSLGFSILKSPRYSLSIALRIKPAIKDAVRNLPFIQCLLHTQRRMFHQVNDLSFLCLIPRIIRPASFPAQQTFSMARTVWERVRTRFFNVSSATCSHTGAQKLVKGYLRVDWISVICPGRWILCSSVLLWRLVFCQRAITVTGWLFISGLRVCGPYCCINFMRYGYSFCI
jgi:hypothetical protein